MNTKHIILASASPRRAELLSRLDLSFIVIPANIDETPPPDLRADQVPEYLATQKANHTLKIYPYSLIIAADTVVLINEKLLNKPESPTEAKQMLQSLSGKTHRVLTGVCLATSQQQIAFTRTTMVTFNHLSESEIFYYIEKHKPYDKAGAYGAQDWLGCAIMQGIEGCYYNVMGLPTADVYAALKKHFATYLPF